jgi:hypothetical protein
MAYATHHVWRFYAGSNWLPSPDTDGMPIFSNAKEDKKHVITYLRIYIVRLE